MDGTENYLCTPAQLAQMRRAPLWLQDIIYTELARPFLEELGELPFDSRPDYDRVSFDAGFSAGYNRAQEDCVRSYMQHPEVWAELWGKK